MTVLGLGIMGSAMAANLAAAGFRVVGWNRSDARERVADVGVVYEPDLKEAVQDADVVITMVADADAVDDVMSGNDGASVAMRRGALWLQMSTVGIAATDRFKDLADYRVLEFIDAPVLGTKGPAEEGALTILASGPERLVPRAQPIFDVIGAKTVWLSPVGAGSRLKLVFNDWVLGLMSSLAETLALARALEVDPAVFLEVISGGAVDAPYAHMKGEKILSEAFSAQFPLKWAHKDAGLILDSLEGTDARLPVTEAIRRQFKRAIDMGHGDDDMSAIYYAAWPEGLDRPGHRDVDRT